MISMQEYQTRRKQILRSLDDRSVLLLPGALEPIRSHDTEYAFRQNSDFFYLSGFNEPSAFLALLAGRPEGEYVLFNRPSNPKEEIWQGKRAGLTGACQDYLADQSFDIAELETRLIELIEGRSDIYYVLGESPKMDRLLGRVLTKLRHKVRSGSNQSIRVHDISNLIHEMRLIKSDSEIAIMRKAAEISAFAHLRTMQYCTPDMYEYELEAELHHEFCKNGARYQAYNSIVGSGSNTCILHYTSNDKKIKNGELVLIDAGCELYNYAADITRTFPANGKFTSEQKAIYELVLAAQTAAIHLIKPGLLWENMQETITHILTEGLIDLGILKGDKQYLLEQRAYQDFYMHKSGHWLGLDVHDVGFYKLANQWRPLQAGMVLTVEPGLYISNHHHAIDSRWHDIGIRIEDDILVTDTGFEILSKDAPKQVEEIEQLMQ